MHRLSRNNCKAVHCIKSILHRVTVGNTAPIMVVSSRQMSHAIFRYPRITSMLLRTTKVNQRGLAADAQSASEPPVIANDSWAAEALEKQGEKLASSEDKPLVLVDDELMKGPPPATIKKLCDDILALNVVEVAQLMSIIQSRLGITDDMIGGFGSGGGGGSRGGGSATAAGAVEAAPVAAAPAKEKEIFDIKLTVFDAKSKIKIIKEVRAITALGLKEAKDLVEKAPCILKTGVKKEEMEQIKKLLTEAGAEIEII